MRFQLYDIQKSSLSGKYLLYSYEKGSCSASNHIDSIGSSIETVLNAEYNYFTPSDEPLLAEFDTLAEFKQNYPELLI